MTYKWRTTDDGLIVVTLEDGSERTPTLVDSNLIGLMVKVQARWSVLTAKIGTKWGIQPEWLRSMVFRESGGNQLARNPEKLPGPEDDGLGLVQITNAALKAGYTDAELLDPETNLNIGARYIVRSLIPRYGRDFPKISAAFNAGSVIATTRNPWGMVCTEGHIESEVSALNWQILDVMNEARRAVALQFGTLDMLPGLDTRPTDPAPPPPPDEVPTMPDGGTTAA